MLDFSNPLHIGYAGVTGGVGLLFLVFFFIFLCGKKRSRNAAGKLFFILNILLLFVFLAFSAFVLTAYLWTGDGFSLTPVENGMIGVTILGKPWMQYPESSLWAVLFGAVQTAVSTFAGLCLAWVATVILCLCAIVYGVKKEKKKKIKKPAKSEPVVDMEEAAALEHAAEQIALSQPKAAEFAAEPADCGIMGERFAEEFLRNIDNDHPTYLREETPDRMQLEELMRQMAQEDPAAEDVEVVSDGEQFGGESFHGPLDSIFAEVRAFTEEAEKEADTDEGSAPFARAPAAFAGLSEPVPEALEEEWTSEERNEVIYEENQAYEESETDINVQFNEEMLEEETIAPNEEDVGGINLDDLSGGVAEERLTAEIPSADSVQDPILPPAAEPAAQPLRSGRLIVRSRPVVPSDFVLPVRILSKAPPKTANASKVRKKSSPDVRIAEPVAKTGLTEEKEEVGIIPAEKPKTVRKYTAKKKPPARKKAVSRFVGKKKTAPKKPGQKKPATAQKSAEIVLPQPAVRLESAPPSAPLPVFAAAPPVQKPVSGRRYPVVRSDGAKAAFEEYIKNKT